jgi:hypothetical protein
MWAYPLAQASLAEVRSGLKSWSFLWCVPLDCPTPCARLKTFPKPRLVTAPVSPPLPTPEWWALTHPRRLMLGRCWLCQALATLRHSPSAAPFVLDNLKAARPCPWQSQLRVAGDCLLATVLSYKASTSANNAWCCKALASRRRNHMWILSGGVFFLLPWASALYGSVCYEISHKWKLFDITKLYWGRMGSTMINCFNIIKQLLRQRRFYD